MPLDLSSVKDREALRSRREPHWQRIRPGCFLGYRPSAREGAGTWIARAYDGGGIRYRLKALGDYGAVPSRDRFAEAKKDAEAFASVVESGGIAEQGRDCGRGMPPIRADQAGRGRAVQADRLL